MDFLDNLIEGQDWDVDEAENEWRLHCSHLGGKGW